MNLLKPPGELKRAQGHPSAVRGMGVEVKAVQNWSVNGIWLCPLLFKKSMPDLNFYRGQECAT